MMTKTYTELVTYSTFEERYRYLQLNGSVGAETFGFNRYLNQVLYRSPEWKKVRREVIIRDNGCDLGIDDRYIGIGVTIHHMNPISELDILRRMDYVLNPEFLITVSTSTHRAIHYGDESLLVTKITERSKNDTIPWR